MLKKFIVEADHPIFKRIYQYCDQQEADDLVTELEEFNYENITVKEKEISTHGQII